ncbi:ArnT family glycosyltransferase [Amycolatopsis sp. H20-H5]|uniref:ArnT family glycosyltransferase n=1 Tax=Amycolatopsis sp. H20-H5 TaxID=3046309 RepID=UPI002DB9AB03|nr:glycosyltransferase family 39 protein [Amycolatopsis sp. H20-H5]MEC3976951.1 glycosyltransferase family 39 protein [Amycolatopsis sp. H20-H5]
MTAVTTTAVGSDRKVVRWEPIALGGVMLLSALLWGWGLGDRSLQPYYAAAVHSMSRDWSVFLFSGYDPAGVVAVDKTPLGFWVQALGVRVFGFHLWAIELVQVAEGVAAVFVLHRVVRRWAGERTALLAALLFALTPITAAINRDNVADTLLVLLLLLAAYFVTRAVETGGAKWLVWAAVFVGLGFLAKMLAAWIVLPGLALAYFAGAPGARGKKLLHLVLAGVVALAVSLSWPALVSLWPGSKPYVGSSADGSIWQLIFGYNGVSRLFGGSDGAMGTFGTSIGTGLGGAPGPLRLFDTEIGGQIAWLLPLALGALVVAAFRARGAAARTRAGWLLWGGWLLAGAAVFSFTGGIFHAYYTAELAPAIAALAAAGLLTGWRWYREGGRARMVLPLAVAGTAVFAFVLLDRTPTWLPWLRYGVLGIALVAVVAALTRSGVVLAGAGLLAVIAGPAAFVVQTAAGRPTVLDAADPTAGPAGSGALTGILAALLRSASGAGDRESSYLRYKMAANTLTPGQAQVLAYAQAQAPAARIALAVEGGSFGSDPFLLNTDARVAPFGGYLGFDATPSLPQLGHWTADGSLRFVLLPRVFVELGQSAKPPGDGASSEGAAIGERIGWAAKHCVPVPPARIGPAAADAGVLFDCAPTR